MYKPFATMLCKDDWLYEVRFDVHVQKFALTDYIPFHIPLALYYEVYGNVKRYIEEQFFLLYYEPSEKEDLETETEGELVPTENTQMLVELVLGGRVL